MRLVGPLVILLGTAGAPAQSPADARFGVPPEPKSFPQASPKDALASVIKAIESKRFDYLLAHLAEPGFVDRRVKAYGGKFDALVEEVTARLTADPSVLKQLKRLATEGDWEIEEDRATAQSPRPGDGVALFRKSGGRWFLKNRNRPPTEAR